MNTPSKVLCLSNSDIAKLNLDANSVRKAVSEAFQAVAHGTLHYKPKTSILLSPGHAFQSLSAVDVGRGYASVKWIGMVPPGGAAKVNINASILLSDVSTGELRSLMDAREITAVRTAGMSAVAAEKLARQDSVSLGLIGAGTQAESHLQALSTIFPTLRSVAVHSRSTASAERLAQRSRELGFDAKAVSARDAVADSDIVVTTVPVSEGFEPFLDPAWIKRGALVIAVDLGRSWLHTGINAMDVIAIDDEAMKHYAAPGNLIPPLEGAHATLSDLVSGTHAGRSDPAERIMFFSSGSAVADLAIAMLAYERALAEDCGHALAF